MFRTNAYNDLPTFASAALRTGSAIAAFAALSLVPPSWLAAHGASQAAGTQTEHLVHLRNRFARELEETVRGCDCVAGVHVVDLRTGDRFGVRDTLVFPQASAIKVPILLELFRRAEAEPDLLRRRVEITEDVRTGGSGVLGALSDGGSALSLEDLAIYMIVHSDNTATNILIRELGMDPVNELSASLGAPGTLLHREMIRPEESLLGNENLSTPVEAARIMERIATCELPMGETACTRVREILELPKGGPMRAPIPASVPVAFKPGAIAGVASAWALVGLPDRPYVVAVMSSYGGDGAALVEEVSAAAYGHFVRFSGATPYGARVSPELKRRMGR